MILNIDAVRGLGGAGDRNMVQFRITKHNAMASISGLGGRGRGPKNGPISDHEAPCYGIDFVARGSRGKNLFSIEKLIV